MKSTLRAKLLPIAITTLLATSPILAQDTSSSISGRVLDASGQPVAGATVQIVHEPSGTTKIATTDASGRYAAQGLRVGGPFDVTVSKAGMAQIEQKNVYLQLAQDTAVNLTMDTEQAKAIRDLSGVTVSASALAQTFSSDNKGMGTNISQRELKANPTPNRSIQDVARLDPRIVITDRGDGSISAMGQNSRYNNITVDSISENDKFGLNANGMPYIGSPISVDTIQEYNISTANYDVASSTVGANINAVTKSGTNDFHGSVYYAYRNASHLVGEERGSSSAPYQDYKGYKFDFTAGATAGGPIVKDKLFFFANYEVSKTYGLGADNATGLNPSLSGASTSNQVSQSDLNKIIDIARQKGLQPGGPGTIAGNLVTKRGLAKIDWNISDNHRASLTMQRTKEDQPIIQGNANNSVGLSSYWYNKNSDTKNYALHFYDDWSQNFSTDGTLSYSDFSQVRTVANQQPQIYVNLGNNASGQPNGSPPYVDFGEDQYSNYNVLHVKSWNASLAGTYYAGDHTIKGGVNFEQDKIYNFFGRTEFGAYTFWGIDNFEKGIYNSYALYQPNTAGGYTLDDVPARWTYRQYTLFLQDTWQFNDNLSIQYGFRIDLPKTGDKPIYNPTFADTFGLDANGSVVIRKAGDGSTPLRNDGTVDGRRLPQPRLSFNYNFGTERMTQLRGGAGLFMSNPPTVWMTNPYQNNGMTLNTYNIRNSANAANSCLPTFSADPHNQSVKPAVPSPACPGATPGAMTVDTIDPNFRLPSVWKWSLGLDRELPWLGTVFTADWEHIQVRDAIWYQNLNIGTPTGVLPDGRLSFYQNPASPTSTNRANANPAFGQAVTYLTNTHKGSANTLTLQLKKPFADGWSASAGVTFGHATEVNPGTSSQASSNYSNSAWVNPNENVASTSNYSIRQRLNASITWQHRFFGDYNTTISAFYDGHIGTPYSWTFGNDVNGDSYSGSDLVYIPKVNDPRVIFEGKTSQQAIEQFYAFIQSDSYLKDHQGEIARRNAARSAWINQLDLSFSQEIPGIFKGNKGEIRLDVYNFTNLLNHKWGQQSYIGFPYTRTLASFAGVQGDCSTDPANCKYIYSLPTDANGNYQPGQKITYVAGRDIKTNVVSAWSMMLTLRYSF